MNPGTYTMEVSERSAGHAIDKMALYKVDGPTYSDNQLTAANESSRAGDNANVGDNSPYNVTVTATDNNDPTNKSDVEFTWVIMKLPTFGPPDRLGVITLGADPLLGDGGWHKVRPATFSST